MDKALCSIIQDILRKAEQTFPYATATSFSNRGMEIDLDRQEEHLSSASSNLGFVLSIFNGEYFEEFATDKLEKDHLVAFCRDAINRATVRRQEFDINTPIQGSQSFRTEEKSDPDRLSTNEKIDMLRQRRARITAGKNVVNCRVTYSDELKSKTFISSSGIIDEAVRNISHFLMAYVSDGNQFKYDYLSTGGTGGLELIDVANEEIDALVDNANKLLGAQSIKPDFYDVVATPEIAGLIAHEAFGHGVETDMYLKDRARSREFLGEIIASPLVNIVDDPTIPRGYGSYFIDDEGIVAQPTYIIKNGRFVQGLTNRYASSVLKLPATATGRRESFKRKVYTRMSNTFFVRGNDDPDDIIESVDRGVYLMKGLSGMEDPKGWGIQVLVLYGKEIRNGRVTDRIFSPLGITGYVPDLLGNVSMVGSDFKLDLGTCGKGYKEYVPVSSGGPHIRTRVRLG
jgi:TldD protein